MDFVTTIVNPALLVLVAGAVQAIAMLFRNQFVLRGVFIVGSILYISYYLGVVSPPLYEAALMSGILASATLYGMASLILDRSRFMIRAEQIPLFEAMGGIEPGLFRRLMRLGRPRVVSGPEKLTRAGVTPDRLYFVRSGQVMAEKGGYQFALRPPLFIGEIAFMTRAPASATVSVSGDAEIVEWSCARLHKATGRDARLRLALHARLAQDLAAKVTAAVGPDALLVLPETDAGAGLS